MGKRKQRQEDVDGERLRAESADDQEQKFFGAHTQSPKANALEPRQFFCYNIFTKKRAMGPVPSLLGWVVPPVGLGIIFLAIIF
jgi:hypothetical protein